MKKLKISPFLIIPFTLWAFTGYLNYFFAMVLVFSLHELGHLFYFWLFNIPYQQIKITLFGGFIEADLEQIPFFERLILYLRWH